MLSGDSARVSGIIDEVARKDSYEFAYVKEDVSFNQTLIHGTEDVWRGKEIEEKGAIRIIER